MIKKRNEFQIISDFFSPLVKEKSSFSLLEDAATLCTGEEDEFVISTDMLVSGIHFLPYDKPQDIACKSIRVNISDVISKGARPKYYFLSIALPNDLGDDWIESFSIGLSHEQKIYDISLMGGDTVSTKGPLTINIVCFGIIKKNKMIKRSGAKAGDNLYVTGEIGSSRVGLEIIEENIYVNDHHKDYFLNKYRFPSPRHELGPKLVDIASSSIDISDGLISDLNHICKASNVGAKLNYFSIPKSGFIGALSISENKMNDILLNGGDDYEILFTSKTANHEKILNLSKSFGVNITKIGMIEDGKGIEIFDENYQKIDTILDGYKHR